MMSAEPRLLWAAGARLGEGALWDDRIGRLWWVDIDGRRLHSTDEAGKERASWELPQEPGHAALTGDPERLILGLRSGHVLFAPQDGRLEALAMPPGHSPRHRLNDGKVDGAGRLWFGTMHEAEQAGEGALHLLGPGRQVARIAGPFTVPNGPAFTGDDAVMYLADSPARRVLAFDIEDGRPVHQREHLRFAEDEGFPDGMTVDAGGQPLGGALGWRTGLPLRRGRDPRRQHSAAGAGCDQLCLRRDGSAHAVHHHGGGATGGPMKAPLAASSRSAPRSAAYA
jgi:D-xylonolactonase